MPDMPPPTPGFLDLLRQFPGAATSQAASTISDLAQRYGPRQAYSRLTHDPMLFTQSQALMRAWDPLSNDWGATRWLPKPVAMIGPQATPPFQEPVQGEMTGVPRHESIHMAMQGKELPAERFLKTLPPQIAEIMRRAMIEGKVPTIDMASEIPARLGGTSYRPTSYDTLNQPQDPRLTQAWQLGLMRPEAQQAWTQYLSELAKTNPQLAAKLMSYTGINPPTNVAHLQSIAGGK